MNYSQFGASNPGHGPIRATFTGCFSSASHRIVILRACDFFGLLHRQQHLGAPFKPGFGLSGIPRHSTHLFVIPSICGAPQLPHKGLPSVSSPTDSSSLRSASQMDRVTQSLGRGVEGPRHCLSRPCCSELFNHRARTGFFPWGREPADPVVRLTKNIQRSSRLWDHGRATLSRPYGTEFGTTSCRTGCSSPLASYLFRLVPRRSSTPSSSKAA